MALTAQAGPTVERIRASKQVVIAHREASVPFSYVDGDGRPIGYAVDLCRQIVAGLATRLGTGPLQIRFLPVSAATRIEAVESEQADLACESATNTEERRARVAFTIPHYVTGTRFLVRADSRIDSLRGFAGRLLLSTTGTAPLKVLREANEAHGLGIRIEEVPDHAAGVDAVARGRADGFAMDEILLQGLRLSRADPERLKVVGKYLTVEALAIMLPRTDPDFKAMVDGEMRRLIRSREAHALHDKWFGGPIPPHGRSLELPMPFLLRDSWRYPSDWVPAPWVMP